jgi:hypothetical protein
MDSFKETLARHGLNPTEIEEKMSLFLTNQKVLDQETEAANV